MDEFRIALSQMHVEKSQELDGLNTTFCKRFWDLCGVEVFHASQTWLDQHLFPIYLNDTNVVLTPKKNNPESMHELSPISCCNVI